MRYFSYHSPGSEIQLIEDIKPGWVRMTFEPNVTPATPRRQIIEITLAVGFQFVHALARSEELEVMMVHGPGMDAQYYERIFHYPVRFGQPYNGLSLPASLLAIPLNPSASQLRTTAERYVANIMRRFPLDIGRQVQELARQQLGAEGPIIDIISTQLGLHRRTLQRRLAMQGLFFEDIIDDIRRQQAIEYLPHKEIPLAQIAVLLGYSEQCSFSRACRRWFGKTPSELRGGVAT